MMNFASVALCLKYPSVVGLYKVEYQTGVIDDFILMDY